jgi:hypothetical protein
MVLGMNGDFGYKPITTFFTQNAGNSANTERTTEAKVQNIMPPKAEVTRQDLDDINPYAGLGLSLSTKATSTDPVDICKAACPEFSNWQGEFTLSEEGKKDATKTLGDLAKLADRVAKDTPSVTKNIESAGIFDALDDVMLT